MSKSARGGVTTVNSVVEASLTSARLGKITVPVRIITGCLDAEERYPRNRGAPRPPCLVLPQQHQTPTHKTTVEHRSTQCTTAPCRSASAPHLRAAVYTCCLTANRVRRSRPLQLRISSAYSRHCPVLAPTCARRRPAATPTRSTIASSYAAAAGFKAPFSAAEEASLNSSPSLCICLC